MAYSPNENADARVRTADLSESDRYRLLASARRRATLEVVANRPTPVELDDLARAVATREDDAATTEEAVRRVAVALHHNHLPRMADMGVVDYDPERQRVE